VQLLELVIPFIHTLREEKEDISISQFSVLVVVMIALSARIVSIEKW
jgi:hypothetical protein